MAALRFSGATRDLDQGILSSILSPLLCRGERRKNGLHERTSRPATIAAEPDRVRLCAALVAARLRLDHLAHTFGSLLVPIPLGLALAVSG